jgi:hypothetical protein
VPTTTSRLALPVPNPNDPADVPADMLALANALDPKTSTFLHGTAASRPAAALTGRWYLATDTGVLAYDTGSAWLTVAGAAPPGATAVVDTLPASPSDGAEVFFQSAAMATDGIMWHLRHRGGKWDFLGGPPINAARHVAEGTSSGPLVALGGPNLTIPLAGDYIVTASARIYCTAAGLQGLMHLRYPNATTEAGYVGNYSSTASESSSVSRTDRHTLTAGTLTAHYRVVGGTGAAYFDMRDLTAVPVRVG